LDQPLNHQPCLDQIECKSSDACTIFPDGRAYCHSCGKYFKKGAQKITKRDEDEDFEFVDEPAKSTQTTNIDKIRSYVSKGFRGISKNTVEFFGVKVAFNSKGEVSDHYYPYSNGGYKHRALPKTFTWVGQPNGLFGKDLFTSGGMRVVITEGEVDALSVAQAAFEKYKKYYPVVSITSASGTKELIEHRDWLRSFSEVVLCLDNDEAGKNATEKALKIVGIDKAKIWNPQDCKDANEVLNKHGAERLNQLIWEAEIYRPAGIIKKEDIWKQIVERKAVPSVPYPACLAGLNEKIKGRRRGEIALFISGTGAGKSTITREIIIDIVKNTDDKVGVISLEESPGETGTKLAGMALMKNPEEEEIPPEELKIGFDEVFGSDQVLLLDHQGSIKDESIISQLEYMCLMGCKALIVDHITILVSEGAEGLTGNEAIDKIMNDLLRLVKRHDVWIGLVSHLRKVQTGSVPFEAGKMPTTDDIRGSGSIKQVSFDIIAFTRNMMAEDEATRNTIKIAVLKSRTVGKTGRVPGAIYNQKTSRLTYCDESFEEI